MNEPHALLARVLIHGNRALAGYAANDLLQTHPAAASGVGPDPLSAWQNWLAARLAELASAVAAGDARIFTEQLRWARTLLTARGLSSVVVDSSLDSAREVLTRELPKSVRSLAADYFHGTIGHATEDSEELSAPLRPTTPENRLTSAYLLAVLEGDRQRASRLILDASQGEYSIAHLMTCVLLPAQAEVGRMWQLDEINVAEEHLVSETTKTVMAQLMARAKFAPRNGKTVLTTGVAGNQIDIGPQTIAYLFELDGWRTIHLGADVPTADIVQAVGHFEADLLGLSVSQVTQLQTVAETINAVRSTAGSENVKIIAGGFAFAGLEHLVPKLGADGYAPNPDGAVRLGCQLTGLPPCDADGDA